MSESLLAIVAQRLLQSPVAGLVGAHGDPSRPAVFPIRPPDEFLGDCVAVNRMMESRDGDNVHAVAAVTVYAAKVSDLEKIGVAVIGALTDVEGREWSYGSAKDVRFSHQDEDYIGADYTGWDQARRQYVRTIEVSVSW